MRALSPHARQPAQKERWGEGFIPRLRAGRCVVGACARAVCQSLSAGRPQPVSASCGILASAAGPLPASRLMRAALPRSAGLSLCVATLLWQWEEGVGAERAEAGRAGEPPGDGEAEVGAEDFSVAAGGPSCRRRSSAWQSFGLAGLCLAGTGTCVGANNLSWATSVRERGQRELRRQAELRLWTGGCRSVFRPLF